MKTPVLYLLRAGFLGFALVITSSQAHHTDTHFDDDSSHHIVYQLNKADPDSISHILFSAGELMRKYGDDIQIVISVFGPGLHLIAKQPRRPIPPHLQQKAASLAVYGISFHACGNTMKSLNWTGDDLFDFAEIVPIGVDDMMLLQEQGFSYVAL